MKILVAPNSFKECSDSVTISNLITKQLNEFFVINVPITDGGDGFIKVIRNYYKGNLKLYLINNSYTNRLNKIIAVISDKKELFFESADLVGLKKIPEKIRNLLILNSAPLGEFLLRIEKDAKTKKNSIKEVIIGIGGTGIHDFGIGMMSVFGLKLIDKNGLLLEPLPINFENVEDIIYDFRKPAYKIKIVIDVQLPLLGKNGSVYTFAPQKGASEQDVTKIERGIKKIVSILDKKYPERKRKLTGAGGGIAAALNYFFDAEIITSKEFILNELTIKKKIAECNAIITGEGKFDHQSFLNKGTGVIIKEGIRQKKRIFLCCGIIEDDMRKKLKEKVNFIQINDFFNSKEESIKNYKEGIIKACKIISQKLK